MNKTDGKHKLDVSEFEKKLITELKELKNGLRSIKEKSFSMDQKDLLGIDSSYDQHPGDLGSETFERGKDLGLKDGIEIKIAKMRDALNRIKMNKYGFCLKCKQPIPIERLRAIPEVELCASCQKQQEVLPQTRRPVEEMVFSQDVPDSAFQKEPGEEPPLTDR